jgi:hypothetical protein
MEREIRTYPATSSHRPIVEVLDVTNLVETGVQDSTEAKIATGKWDESKTEFRNVAREAVKLTEFVHAMPTVRLVGKQAKHVIEVVPSRKRKQLPTHVVGKLQAFGFAQFVQEETTVTLRGELAAWVLTLLKDREGKDANIEVNRRMVLSPLFDQEVTTTQKHPEVLEEASDAGIYAAAVEAKLK